MKFKVYMVVPSIVAETVFLCYLKITCHIDFKCSSINFQKERKQPAKHKHLGIAPLKLHRMETSRLSIISLMKKNIL